MARVAPWQAGMTVSIALAGAGFVFATPELFLVATIPLVFLGYAAAASVPDPTGSVQVSRTCSTTHPVPGEPVDVTLAVENVGPRILPDVRITDAIPSTLGVVSGQARTATSLRPGETATLSYRLRPPRGSFSFEDPTVRIRSLSGGAVSTIRLDAEGDDELTCRVPVDGVPVHRRTIPRIGAIPIDDGGPGLEFHSTREYRHGDPPRRIDWRRYAREDELGTIRYRRQEGVSVVLVVDGREVAAQVSTPGQADGRTLSVYAAVVTAGALGGATHRVGLAALDTRSHGDADFAGPPAYLPPGTGTRHTARLAALADVIATGGQGRGPSLTSQIDRLEQLRPAGAQLLVCTPLLDDEIVDAIRTMRRHGQAVTVISPDLATADHVGARVAAVERAARIERLRRTDVAVLDWDPADPLAVALDRLRRAGVVGS